MSHDNVNLNQGFEGFHATNKGLGSEQSEASGIAKTQHGQAQDMMGTQKGALGKSLANTSVAAGNNFEAVGKVHGQNAEAGTRFINTTAQAEETATTATTTEGNTLDTQAFDIKRVNG